MCRLFGISSNKAEDLKGWVNPLLVKFENCNKDGTGLAFTRKGKIEVYKKGVSALPFIFSNHYNIHSGSLIAHLRSATTGEVLDKNSHPFVSEDGSIALAHNGQIHHYEKYKEELINKGHVFSSDVDSEVLLHAYEEFGDDLIDGLNKA